MKLIYFRYLSLLWIFTFATISLSAQLAAPINEPRFLKFTYDDSGNQIERRYQSALIATPKTEEIVEESLASQFEEMLKVYPNPTRGQFSIEWEKEFSQYISQVEVLSADALIQKNPINASLNKLNIDLTTKQSGIYFVRFHFTDGSIVSKKVIKL